MVGLLRSVTLIAATITTGLAAGVFYAFACSVMLGLNRTDDRTFVSAMQRINVSIINPWFMLSFIGALVFTVLAAVLRIPGGGGGVLPWIVAALVLYLAVVIITGGVNVPLNNALEAAGNPDAIAEIAAVRARFEATWNRWNIVRAVVSTLSFGCLTWALVLHARAVAG